MNQKPSRTRKAWCGVGEARYRPPLTGLVPGFQILPGLARSGHGRSGPGRSRAPLTFTDQDPPAPDNPVAPARRSAAAQAKASGQHNPAGQLYYSFRGLLDHLATLTRNQVRYTGTDVTIAMLAEPTSIQRQAFELLGAAIPLTLK